MRTIGLFSPTPQGTSSPPKTQGTAACLIARLATGLVLGCFGVWELTAPGQWTSYIPSIPVARLQALPVVLAHGWILFMLAAAAWINFLPAVTAWLAVAALAEVVAALVLGSGLTSTLIRDVGLLALALAWALAETGLARRAVSTCHPTEK